jgi:RNA polymerase sigma-70 factor (ECF subfamily)
VSGEVVYARERFRGDEARVDPPTDRGRFERILDRHHRRLRRVVVGMVGADRADDVLQDSYLKAYRRLPKRFANEAHEATWVYRVVYRCCLDELRRERRSKETSRPEIHVVDRTPSGVADALRGLSPRDRAVLLLVDLLGFSYDEAAAILRVPRGTVASRLNAARERFRRSIDA